MRTKTAEPVYAVDLVAQEWAAMSFGRRLMLRIVSPNMARAARHLATTPRGYVNVPVFKAHEPGPLERRFG